jgi:alkanesulfonate monooxygenase SsuD/methylene tetrahydromethanopterin reductase-like flavin-dependent oxidoreductase (luciferase family)
MIYGLKTIDESRERYREALEIFFAACQSRALNFQGKHFAYREAELHVKPVQEPYPPLWFPSSNKESIEFTASHGYHTAFLGKLADVKPHFERYREVWEKHRNDPGRHNAHVKAPFLAKTQHLVIAETDAEAEKLGLEAYWKWAGHIHHLTRKLGRPDVHLSDPYAEDSAQRLITGSPRTASKSAGNASVTSELSALHLFLRRPAPARCAARANAAKSCPSSIREEHGALL